MKWVKHALLRKFKWSWIPHKSVLDLQSLNSFSLKFNNPQNFYSTQDNTLSMFISLQLTFLHSYDQLTRSLCTWCNSTEVIVCPLKKKTGSWSKEGLILCTWIKKDKFLIKRNWSYWDEISQWTFHEVALLVHCLLVELEFERLIFVDGGKLKDPVKNS